MKSVGIFVLCCVVACNISASDNREPRDNVVNGELCLSVDEMLREQVRRIIVGIKLLCAGYPYYRKQVSENEETAWIASNVLSVKTMCCCVESICCSEENAKTTGTELCKIMEC